LMLKGDIVNAPSAVSADIVSTTPSCFI
jgi:hypothetical protein